MNEGYAELEIRLQRASTYTDSYFVALRFTQAGSDDEKVWTHGDDTAPIRFDPVQLRKVAGDPDAYGNELSTILFSDWVGDRLQDVRQSAVEADVPLRVRLFIPPTAADLHSLRWESLRDPWAVDSASESDPQAEKPRFTTQDRIWFSRYLTSDDWRRVQRRSKSELRALIVIANPSDICTYTDGDRPLAIIDVKGELERAREGLVGVRLSTLVSGDDRPEHRPTVNNLTAAMRDGYDIIYFVAHGALLPEPRVWLEKESGTAEIVTSRRLTARMREAVQLPRLVVLVSCQSAGDGRERRATDEGALAALGPEIARAGVPAVIAMQGNVTMETVDRFMPVFFRQLQRDGQLDRAMAAARGAVRDRLDSWMPVLFMRLKSGRLWYAPGFGGKQSFSQWPSLLDSIELRQCTPIIGPGLTDWLLGSRRELLARRWSEQYRFPMTLQGRDDLPQVAQFVATQNGDGGPRFIRRELEKYIKKELIDRYGADLPPNMHDLTLVKLHTEVWKQLAGDNPDDPHNVLARLPFKLYITTSPYGLLEEALRIVGKEPQVEVGPWNDDLVKALVTKRQQQRRDDDDDDSDSLEAEPYDERHPLVYHAFGRVEDPNSVVLTEDEYFDYLMRITREEDKVPRIVNKAKANSALLFLGFQVDDWMFRVLFRSIMSQDSASLRERHTHVAVQTEPEEAGIAAAERVRSYLDEYFKGAKLSVYWGSPEDFIPKLLQPAEAIP